MYVLIYSGALYLKTVSLFHCHCGTDVVCWIQLQRVLYKEPQLTLLGVQSYIKCQSEYVRHINILCQTHKSFTTTLLLYKIKLIIALLDNMYCQCLTEYSM